MGEVVSLEEFRKSKEVEELDEMQSILQDIIDSYPDTYGTTGYHPGWYIHAQSVGGSSDMNSQHDVRGMSLAELLRACIRKLMCGKI